ncbi:chromosomal protein MC1 [Haloferax mediterranei ATCC 33500]|uniref:Chromosomal protein MC1 n=1 Tax=Haloferax mediterranei (strain ATCC 33500 / DSM 1411 / JCM 8866 / NBRC 14739 / NCIMB 2177 / R-4) TaxID=523841 RepID=I3R4P0_HALMT|nr:non-histone chromosomal MC1 family protein [Haloferax mediterranei]AFK19200.1 nonhistone chromosomal protein [Haloferax mediterranei ATCC 33500]AHZ21438.1 chromosomal protein MC1 [Haloferax mediterranei ATCC 33500]EMA03896.1 nonhistone chromosomal protein [Haloferax mediterranei ATCC 33500]MDX5989300.1 non-histone chromosomal MC1 family protein [Haloferax mediterranei ATCC 33500]QCQ75669.1 chromosomal protein MC1 [Haloferax mediterranei ATCC 33500]
MVREDGKRNFVLVEDDGEETSVFSGKYPRQAALKAARRLPAAPSLEDVDGKATIRLRERGTDKVHVYEGWAWIEEKDDDAPDWMDDEVTRANVSKQRIEHIES